MNVSRRIHREMRLAWDYSVPGGQVRAARHLACPTAWYPFGARWHKSNTRSLGIHPGPQVSRT